MHWLSKYVVNRKYKHEYADKNPFYECFACDHLSDLFLRVCSLCPRELADIEIS